MKKIIAFLGNDIFFNKKTALSLFGFNLLAMLISLIFPYLNYIFIHYLTDGHLTIKILSLILLGLVALLSIQSGINYLSQIVMVRIEKKYHQSLRKRLLNQLYLTDYDKKSIDINYLLSRDIVAVDNWLEKILSRLFIECLELICILFLLFKIQPKLTVVSIIISFTSFLLLKMVSQKLSKVGEAYRNLDKEAQKSELDILDNYAELKISHLQSEFIDKQNSIWERQNHAFAKLKKIELFFTIQNATDKFLLELMFIYLIGGYFVLNGQLNIAELILFSNYYILCNGLINNIRNYLIDYRANIAPYLKDLIDYLDANSQMAFSGIEEKATISKAGADLDIILSNVAYKNALNKEIFKSANLKIPFGQSIGIYGSSGSGKSTLLNIIRGKLSPTSGKLSIGNWYPSEIDPDSLAKIISYVSQEPLIVDGTIKENLLMINPKFNDEEIINACRQGGLGKYAKEGPDGLQKKTGKNGKFLSGGEKQRLSFVRAILSDSPIMLLDEPTAALDKDNERLIVNKLSSYAGKKTIIVVSHRKDTLQFVEHKINLELL